MYFSQLYRTFDGIVIDWVSGQPPIDEPACGYRGQLCIPSKTYTLEIIGGVVGGIALVLVIVALIIYRYLVIAYSSFVNRISYQFL